MNNMRKPWQRSGIILALITLCLLASTAFGFNTYFLRGSSSSVIALNQQIEILPPTASNSGDVLYRGKQSKTNGEISRAFDKLPLSKPSDGPHHCLHSASNIAGLSGSVHKNKLHQLYQLTDIPPPFSLTL